MTRFKLDELVGLGDGWFRRMRAGEELFRLSIYSEATPWSTRWHTERALLEYLDTAICTDRAGRRHVIETMLVPPLPQPGAQPDPRQLELPWSEP